jgi:hypothetical protein
MNYKQLIEKLNTLPPERLEDNVVVYDETIDEFLPIVDSETANPDTTDVLDEGHFYLIITNVKICEKSN